MHNQPAPMVTAMCAGVCADLGASYVRRRSREPSLRDEILVFVVMAVMFISLLIIVNFTRSRPRRQLHLAFDEMPLYVWWTSRREIPSRREISIHFNPSSSDAHCCHMGPAIEHPVPDWVKQSFVIFDIRALWRSALSVRVPGCQKLQMTA